MKGIEHERMNDLPQPVGAPTQQDYNTAKGEWITAGVAGGLFVPLDAAYQNYAVNLKVLSMQGVLNSLKAFKNPEQIAEMTRFLQASPQFIGMNVPLHRFVTHYISYQLPFFELLGSFVIAGLWPTIMECMMRLLSLPQLSHVELALTSAVMNVATNLKYDISPADVPKLEYLIVTRLEILTKYLYEMAKAPPLVGYTWTLSGSDPHCEGAQAVFLECQTAAKFKSVMKPHSLKTEAGLVSLDGLLTILNDRLPDEFKLPTLEVFCQQEEFCTKKGYFGLERFVEKVGSKNGEQARCYFTQIGMLAFLAKLFGLTDLHQDNILPAVNGPLIVDGECAFIKSVMDSKSLKSTLLLDSVNNGFNAFNEPAVAHFTVSEAYDKVKAELDVWIGFSMMQQLFCCAQIRERMKYKLLDLLGSGPTIRIVPFATDELSYRLNIFFTTEDREEFMKIFLGELLEEIQPFDIRLDDEKALEVLLYAFTCGDIPIFQIQIRLGQLSPFFINGLEAGYCASYMDPAAIERLFEENLSWLLSLTREDVKKQFPVDPVLH